MPINFKRHEFIAAVINSGEFEDDILTNNPEQDPLNGDQILEKTKKTISIINDLVNDPSSNLMKLFTNPELFPSIVTESVTNRIARNLMLKRTEESIIEAIKDHLPTRTKQEKILAVGQAKEILSNTDWNTTKENFTVKINNMPNNDRLCKVTTIAAGSGLSIDDYWAGRARSTSSTSNDGRDIITLNG